MGTHRSLALRPLSGFCDHIAARISRPGKPLLVGNEPTDKVIDQLLEKRLASDALQLLAYALPPRELVWWTCLCTWHAHGDELEPVSHAAMGAVVHWVQQPTAERAQALPNARNLDAPVQRLIRLARLAADGNDMVGAASLAAGAVLVLSARGREGKNFAVPYAKMALRIARGELPWSVDGAKPAHFTEFTDWAYESHRDGESAAPPAAATELPRRDKRFSFRSSPDS